MPVARRVFLFLALAILLFILLFLAVPVVSWSQGEKLPDTPSVQSAIQLAERVHRSLREREPIVLAVRNLSSVSSWEFNLLHRAFDVRLKELGHGVLNEHPKHTRVLVLVSFTEGIEGFLWVAEIKSNETVQTVMLPVARFLVAGAPRPAAAVLLQRELLLESPDPILDVSLMNTPDDAQWAMLVLQPAKLSLFRRVESGWEWKHSVVLPAPILRDPRGQITGRGGAFEALLPGMVCEGMAVLTIRISCDKASDSRPRMAPGRNFFVEPDAQAKIPPFFSSVVVRGPDSEDYVAIAGVDARMILLGKKQDQPVTTISDWGSDIWGPMGACGENGAELMLASRSGDWTMPDSLIAFDIGGGSPRAVSAPLDFSGPITALWGREDGKSATAVARNLQTGKYEAYRITFSCGQ